MSGSITLGTLVLNAESLVNSFNSRTGAVIPMANDYNINQLAGVSLSSPANGNLLQYNGTNWQNVNTDGYTYVDTYAATITAEPYTFYQVHYGTIITAPSSPSNGYKFGVRCGVNTTTINFSTNVISNLNNYINSCTVINNGDNGTIEFVYFSNQTAWSVISVTGNFYFNGQQISTPRIFSEINGLAISSPINGQILSYNGSNWVNSNTVTSVALSVPSEFSVSGSPITTTGTLSITKTSQLQNLVYASPSGLSGVPTFRSLVLSDLPTLPSQLIPFYTFTLTAESITNYIGLNSLASTSPSVSFVNNRNGTFSNLYIKYTSGAVAGGLTATLNINGVSTSLTCGITSPSSSASDTTHTVSSVVGDVVAIEIVASNFTPINDTLYTSVSFN